MAARPQLERRRPLPAYPAVFGSDGRCSRVGRAGEPQSPRPVCLRRPQSVPIDACFGSTLFRARSGTTDFGQACPFRGRRRRYGGVGGRCRFGAQPRNGKLSPSRKSKLRHYRRPRPATLDRRKVVNPERRGCGGSNNRAYACAPPGPGRCAFCAGKPRPGFGRGFVVSGSVAVGLAAARPDEGEALAVFVVEEVGVDRRVEARVVQLDREVVAALARALRPGCPSRRPVAKLT